MHRTIILFLLVWFIPTGCGQEENVVKIAVTTDVHGMIFPYDFISREPSDHSLAHIYNYVLDQRAKRDTIFFILDNGDFLQGQPTVYFYNFIDTGSVHLSARVMNFMGYSAGTVGNHDIEAGPAVYNRIRNEFSFPWLAANAINIRTGEPFFEPYTILEARDLRIAVFGLITPGIPYWLPENLWPDMEFRDMVETARKWVPVILEEEKPDLLVGLFHSGTDTGYGGNPGPYLNENAVLHVARQVPGFHVIFAGHDHRVSVRWIVNVAGDSVLVVDPGSHGRYAGEVTVSFDASGITGRSAQNVAMTEYQPSRIFQDQFSKDRRKVTTYLDDTITWLSGEMSGAESLFGPSPLMSLIHSVQLDLSGADLSFASPLSLDARLEEGPVLVSDMFKLYRFENMLYVMELTGSEIDGFLEHAASIWFNTMTGPGDHLLQYENGKPGRLANPYYNFSSAAGIRYTIDVTEDPGERVRIHGFSDGTSFDPTGKYRVAINSYRGNGGGGHLISGAGIPKEELSDRITWSTDIDLRYYLMQYLTRYDTLVAEPVSNWYCIPESWVKRASEAERAFFY